MGSTLSELDGCTFYLTPLEWPLYYVYEQDNGVGNVRGWSGPPGPQGQFTFKRIWKKDCYLISAKQWPNWYIYMQDNGEGNVRAYEGDPGPQGHWYVTTRKDGYKQLSTVQWPNWYMYMQDNSDGNVRGWNGDPGPQGHFHLHKVEE